MKYLYIVTAVFLMGCSTTVPTEVEVKGDAIVKPIMPSPKQEQRAIKSNETVINEPKVIKNIASDVPASCVMWSDGCNVCTRTEKGKASCTTGPECINRMFSCLEWQ